eukprot:TRINITY_DN76496_c0_g1_i1.p1 TRINITY_DN76496_c0_g1~~TRINITY_DN76496_c0_g1_i1.p1  ORF type:complete len:319 (+),score=52.72 TRINITY_DN76496_c0_g1_i1:55-1011(+)
MPGAKPASVFPLCLAAGTGAAILLQLLVPQWTIRRRTLCCLLVAYLPSYFDGSEHRAAPRRSVTLQRYLKVLVRQFVNTFFDVHVAIEDRESLAKLKQCIIAIHPHGVLSLDHMLTFCGYSEELDALLPVQHRSALAAGVLFKIPFLRELNLMGGGVNAGRSTAAACLRSGLSLSVVPGGEREQLLACAGPVEQLVLHKRNGFVKLALNHGVPIVPVYCFGEAQMFYQSRFLFHVRSWVQRKLGVALVMPYGRWSLPGVPLPVRLTYQVGRPVEMPHLPAASPSEVEEHHGRYKSVLQELFDSNKAAAGFSQLTLQLV